MGKFLFSSNVSLTISMMSSAGLSLLPWFIRVALL
jgi:hypothetical protein